MRVEGDETEMTVKGEDERRGGGGGKGERWGEGEEAGKRVTSFPCQFFELGMKLEGGMRKEG